VAARDRQLDDLRAKVLGNADVIASTLNSEWHLSEQSWPDAAPYVYRKGP
jgi:hypothetical protein